METLLAYATNTAVVGVAGLVVGVIFSQRIKDYLSGVPTGFRTAMTAVEAKAKADAQAAIADVFARFTPSPVKPVAPATPVAPPAEPPKA